MRWACQESGPDEWELLSGASLAAIDFDRCLHYPTLHPRETDEGDRTGSFCLPCFLRSKKWVLGFQKVGSLLPPPRIKTRRKSNGEVQFRATQFRSGVLDAWTHTEQQSVANDITSECFNNFGASAPGPNPQKTGAVHSSATSGEAPAAFKMNGQSLGLLLCVSGPLRGI